MERSISLGSVDEMNALYGALDVNIRTVENCFGVSCVSRDGGSIILSGEDEVMLGRAADALEYLKSVVDTEGHLTSQTLEYTCAMFKDGHGKELGELDGNCVCLTFKGRPIKPRTVGQHSYVEAIRKNTVVFGIGPAGTGKTFLAVATAVSALRSKQISRIVLTRPAVEAGEKLGFLPGDLQTKIDPYLRPLYDALFEMFGSDGYTRYIERGTIEIAPLAYMRGRTLDDAFIILDEAQNTTGEQMKMLLTRLGNNSKLVVTGDLTQTDLPRGAVSGLAEAAKVLEHTEDIAIHRFTDRDVVRHPLVKRIILAYERYGKKD